MSEHERPEVATNARLVRRLVVDAANELDIAIRHAQDDLRAATERIKELEGRRDRLDRISELDDDLLERLVRELGAVVPGGRRVQ